MPINRYLWLVTLCLLLGKRVACAADAAASATGAASARPDGQPARELIAPLFHSTRSGSKLEWSLSPLMSRSVDKDVDTEEIDFAYPLLTYDRFGEEYRFQIIQLFSFSGGKYQSGDQAKRFTIFPFYFQQRSLDTNLNYTAVMPFYGHLRNRLMRDEIDFVAMPFYLKTRKRDIVTRNYLFPFFHLREGDGLKGWQLWPLVGREHKDVTTKTNGFGDTEVIGGHDKFFAAWPFFFEQRTGIGTANPQTNHLFLPFYSLQRSPLRDSSTYLWPFGLTMTDDREKKYREYGLPWPFVAFARGEGKTMNRVWPLFGNAHNDTLRSDFYFWPLYKYNRAKAAPLERERTRILFYLYSDLTEKNTDTGKTFRATDLWPLFTARKGMDGSESFQALALFEPLVSNNKSVLRNHSPAWALWRTESDPKTGRKLESYLLNLYRQETTPASRKCSLFFGLLHYQSTPEGSQWRFFRPPEATGTDATQPPK